MKYDDLKKIQMKWNGKVCLFGTGLIGSTWAYDLIEAIGFSIDFYCDNNKKENTVIRNGVKTISLEELYDLNNNVFVFITTSEKHQKNIRNQLEQKKIYNILEIGFSFLQDFIESLTEKNLNVRNQFHSILEDAEYISRQFNYYMGYFPDLEVPKTFNEKIQWLKLYDRQKKYVELVDKYSVKKYVADKIGEEYIIPTLGIYRSFNEIEFNKYPQQFVLKCTHDSGSVVICKDKNYFCMREAQIILETALMKNYYWVYREWPYKNVKPRIIVERYIAEKIDSDLKDYKFFCFHGKVKLIQVDIDRFFRHKRNLYTTDWKYVDAEIKYPNEPERIIKRPRNLDKMIFIAEELSKGIPHVRVDLYSVNNRIYFGELTFHHGAGYEKFAPESLEYELGNYINLRGRDKIESERF